MKMHGVQSNAIRSAAKAALGRAQCRKFIGIRAVNFYFFRKKNSMHTKVIRLSFAFVTLACCGIAHAHPGHGNGYLAGLAHPLLGLDHLIAMVAVGFWASQIGGRAAWLVPASFVALMSLGAGMGMAGMAGMALPFVESSIATSILVLGLLIAFSIKVSPGLGGVLVGFFALFHGVAHGTEMPALTAPWQYGLGLIAATSVLHALGLGCGTALCKQRQWLRVLGFLVAAAGSSMIVVAR
jgi:urease accessory protein